MNELGLRSITRRKKPGYKKGKANQVFPSLLNQNFVTRPSIMCGVLILPTCIMLMVMCVITALFLTYLTPV